MVLYKKSSRQPHFVLSWGRRTIAAGTIIAATVTASISGEMCSTTPSRELPERSDYMLGVILSIVGVDRVFRRADLADVVQRDGFLPQRTRRRFCVNVSAPTTAI